MAMIKYVGKKARREDTVAGTRTVWVGAGDVQEVPDLAVPKLLKHPDAWELAEGKSKKAAAPAAPEPDAPNEPSAGGEPVGSTYLMATENGPLSLDALDKDTLRQLAKEAGLKIHHTKSEDFFRAELAKAAPVN